MKFLEKIIHKHEPKFAKGGKLEKWNPVFESFTTLVFTPALTTKKGAHIRDGVDLKRTMMMVILALVPCLLFGIYNTGHWEMVAEAGTRNIAYLAFEWTGSSFEWTRSSFEWTRSSFEWIGSSI